MMKLPKQNEEQLKWKLLQLEIWRRY